MYFPELKVAIEVDEKGHTDRDEEKENEREEKIKKNLDVNLLELVFMQKIMIFLLRLVKKRVTLLNQIKKLK